MTIEEAISDLQRRFPGYQRGKTAMPGSSSGYYDRMKTLNFESMDRTDRVYYAKSTKGTEYYVGIDDRSKKISCGPKVGAS